LTAEQRDKGKAALGAAARAFTKAQKDGNVWVGEQGTFETYQMFDGWHPKPPANPDQLRLEDH
jgi:hypothetical protein